MNPEIADEWVQHLGKVKTNDHWCDKANEFIELMDGDGSKVLTQFLNYDSRQLYGNCKDEHATHYANFVKPRGLFATMVPSTIEELTFSHSVIMGHAAETELGNSPDEQAGETTASELSTMTSIVATQQVCQTKWQCSRQSVRHAGGLRLLS